MLVDGAGVGDTLRPQQKTRFFYLQVIVSMTNRLNKTSPLQINTEGKKTEHTEQGPGNFQRAESNKASPARRPPPPTHTHSHTLTPKQHAFVA